MPNMLVDENYEDVSLFDKQSKCWGFKQNACYKRPILKSKKYVILRILNKLTF